MRISPCSGCDTRNSRSFSEKLHAVQLHFLPSAYLDTRGLLARHQLRFEELQPLLVLTSQRQHLPVALLRDLPALRHAGHAALRVVLAPHCSDELRRQLRSVFRLRTERGSTISPGES
jgi:hypothetical protein